MCLGPKGETYKVAVPENRLLVHDLFEQFPQSADKVYIVRIAIGTQAAFDLIHGDDARGECTIEKFLSEKRPGFADIVATLRAEQPSPNATVEDVVLRLITKYCGLDTYQNVMNTARTAIDLLEEDKKS